MKLDDAAAHLEALGNPTRLKIYRTLIRAGDAGLPVGRLQDKLKIAPSTLSHHIKALVVVGLVNQVREATTLVCHANYEVMRGLVDFLVAECCAGRRKQGCEDRGVDLSRRLISILLAVWENVMSQAKTVAIIGAGPVGLAAAAHVLERGLRPIVLEAGDTSVTRCAQWSHVQLFSPWEYNIDRAAERLLAPTGWNSPDPHQYPTGAELMRALPRTAGEQDRPRGTYSNAQPRHRHQPRRLRQAEEQGPRGGAVRDPLPERTRTQDRQRRRRDRRIRHLAFAQSGRRQRPARDRRTASGGTDRLRHAGRARKGTFALCRQNGCGARRRTFGDRHPDRPRPACGTIAGDNGNLAVARQRSRQGLRRRRQRQARRARRTGLRVRRSGRCGSDQARNRISRSASAAEGPRLSLGTGECCSRRLVGRRTDRGDGLPARSRFRARTAHPARPGDRMPGGAGATDRSERAQLRHRAAAWRAGTGAAPNPASISPA